MSRVEQWELEEAKEDMVEASKIYQDLLEQAVAQEIEDALLYEEPFGVELTWPQAYWRSLENQRERDRRARKFLEPYQALQAILSAVARLDVRGLLSDTDIEGLARESMARSRSLS